MGDEKWVESFNVQVNVTFFSDGKVIPGGRCILMRVLEVTVLGFMR